MNWIKINPNTDLIGIVGMHVLVKGRVIKTGREFYATGYIAQYGGGFILEREEDQARGYIDCVRGFSQYSEYWIINIDEIKESR